jgi:hypothetical protein
MVNRLQTREMFAIEKWDAWQYGVDFPKVGYE